MQHSVFSAPLIIEINDGINTLPHETGDVDKTISSSFVQIINVSEARDTQMDLGQLIEKNSGIKIRRTGGIGSYSSISIRGKSSDQVMVYMDGILVNDASGGSVDLSQIPLNQVSQIEIYKDIIPIEFGEAANGGVINIITHRVKQEDLSRIRMGAGSFSTLSADVNQTKQYKKWQFIFSGGYLKSKNDFSFLNEKATFQNPYDDVVENRQNNQLKQYNVTAKAKYLINAMQSITYQTEVFNKLKQIPSIQNRPETRTSLLQDNTFFSLNYLNTSAGSRHWELNINTKVGLKNTVYDDAKGQIGLSIPQLVNQDIKTWSSKFYVKYSRNDYQWVNNSNFRYEKLSTNDRFKENSLRSNTRMILSNAMQGNFYFFNKKLIISPAGRFFLSLDRFLGGTLREGDSSGVLKKQNFTITPQIGLKYRLSNTTDIKLNAGQYYRLPNYIELFGTQGLIGSNETLKPEQGINVDVGFEHFQHPNSKVFTKFQWYASLYHSVIKDEISYSFNARGIGKPDNNRKSIITGIENTLLLELNYSIEFTSNTTLQLPQNRSDPNKTKLLAGRPTWSQVSRLSWDKNAINLFVEHVGESPYYFDSDQRLYGKARSIFNLGVKLHSKKMNTSLTFNNIFNHRNKDFYSQVSPGFSIFLSTIFAMK